MNKFLLTAIAVMGVSTSALAAPPPAVFNWTGFYVGAEGGGGWVSSRTTALSFQEIFLGFVVSSGTFGPGFQNSSRLSGGFGGGTVGFNWQSGAAVFGLEGDISAAHITGTSDCSATYGGIFGAAPGTSSCNNKLNSFETLTARLGWAVNHALLYLKGGGAWAHFNHNVAANPVGGPWLASTSDDRSGWTVGGGIEYAFWGNWSAKVEYDYMGFGTKNLTMTLQLPANATFIFKVHDRETVQAIKAGVNYRFNWGG